MRIPNIRIPNINCIYYKRGVCDLPEAQKLLKLFRPTCLKLDDNECIFVKQHPKPPAPPPPPPKKMT